MNRTMRERKSDREKEGRGRTDEGEDFGRERETKNRLSRTLTSLSPSFLRDFSNSRPSFFCQTWTRKTTREREREREDCVPKKSGKLMASLILSLILSLSLPVSLSFSHSLLLSCGSNGRMKREGGEVL